MRSRRSVWQAIALGALSLCACGHAPKVDSDDLLPPTHEAQVWLQGRLDALVAAAPKVKLDGDKPTKP